MANTFKKVIDRLVWAQVSPMPNAHAAAVSVCSDLRNDISRNPFVYQLVSNAILNRYNIITKGSAFAVNPGLGGTFGAGAACAFIPSFGLVGTIAAGATTTSVTLTTALPTAVGVNMLANRGGSGEYGYKLRIIDNGAGGSGKTVERYITGNTASYAAYLVLARPTAQAIGSSAMVTWVFAFGALEALPLTGPALLAADFGAIPTWGWASLAFIVLGATVGTYALNAYALARAESSLVAVYIYLQPLVSAAAAAFFLDQHLTGRTLLAGAIIGFGVYLSMPRARRPEMTGKPPVR